MELIGDAEQPRRLGCPVIEGVETIDRHDDRLADKGRNPLVLVVLRVQEIDFACKNIENFRVGVTMQRLTGVRVLHFPGESDAGYVEWLASVSCDLARPIAERQLTAGLIHNDFPNSDRL